MEPIQLLILQLSRVTPLFASVSDEKVTETLQFHLLRRLGVPGISLTVFKRLLDDIQQSCLLPSSRDVTLSLLNAYCRQQTYVYESVNVNMESLSPLIPFSSSSASSAPNHALHPIGLFQTLKDKIFAEAGEAYVESTKLLSTFQIHFPNVNNTQLQTFCDAWSSPSSSLISLKSLQLFFFPLGFHIEMHSLLGMSLISSLRPHQSSISLLTACQTEIERQMVMRYGETVQLDDLVMYLEESMALPLAINSAVLLIHVFVLPHPRIYVSSSSLSSFLRMKEPVEKIIIPIEETIRIPSSQFLYAANLSDRWSPDVMLRYLTEALELTQYKGAFVLREISGADYILMSESMREILGSVEQRLHRLKLKEHADNLLLQVVSHAYTSARDEDIMHWNCFEIAGMLYENECPMAALLVARNLWSARELIRTSPETCQSKISLECPAEEAAALKLLAPFLWSLNTCEEYENCASDEKDEETSSSPPPLYTASSLLGQSLIIPEQDENSDSSSSNPSTPASVEINDTERIINTEQMITVAQSTSLPHAVELDASASLDASILVITEFSNSVSNKPEDESKAGGSIPPNLLDRPETVNFNELTPDQMSKNEDQYLNKQGITPAQEALLTEREISVPPSVANASKIDPSLELKLAALQLRLEAALATQRPNVPETTQLVNIVAPVSTINQKSVWVQLLSRVQHKGVSVNYDGKVDHVVARWMAMARAFLAESSSCSTSTKSRSLSITILNFLGQCFR